MNITDIAIAIGAAKKNESGGGTVTPEQIAAAVEEYMQEHPVTSTGEELVQKTASDTNVTLDYNKTYVFPEMTELEITMSALQENIANVCTVWFTSGSTPTHLVLNNIRGDIIVESLTVYRLVIEDGYASLNDWSAVK